jgi:chromosome segregation ATPase
MGKYILVKKKAQTDLTDEIYELRNILQKLGVDLRHQSARLFESLGHTPEAYNNLVMQYQQLRTECDAQQEVITGYENTIRLQEDRIQELNKQNELRAELVRSTRKYDPYDQGVVINYHPEH